MSTESSPSPAPHASPAGGYQVIARRYRPRFFHEVVGQEATAETLKQGILHERLAHAYLFCGPRGVGKTSMARIFARALQCPNTEGGDPCDRCATCDRIFRGEDMDVVEMDGASNRGIDDIRELIQHVKYAPASGRFRIFIIDEVHMLTREAFNALLKTLEEPPAHVKFIFATTEIEKVLATVISRCQRCDFSAVAPSDIVRRLQQICDEEQAQPELGLLERIADLARGGMRDSQSLLDQLLSFAGDKPALEDLDRITGRMAPAAVSTLLDLVATGERHQLVRELQRIGEEGVDPAVLLEQIVEGLRSRLHDGVNSDWQDVDIERNLIAQEILQESRLRVRQLGRADLILELALLRISTLDQLIPLADFGNDSGTGVPRPSVPPKPPGANSPPVRPSAPSTASAKGAHTPSKGSGGSGAQSAQQVSATQHTSNAPVSVPPVDAPAPLYDSPRAAGSNATAVPTEVTAGGESGLARARRELGNSDSRAVEGARAEFLRTLGTVDPHEDAATVSRGRGRADTPTAEGAFELTAARVLEVLEEVSPTIARMVSDRVRISDGGLVRLQVAEGTQRLVDPQKLMTCRQRLESLGGENIQLQLETVELTEGDDEETPHGEEFGYELPGTEPPPPPEIVEKAKELFRGQVQARFRRPPTPS